MTEHMTESDYTHQTIQQHLDAAMATEFDQTAPAELGPLEKPYTYLPEYADVAYVDGKLRVAQGILSRTSDPEKRRRWQQTVDILLGQRAALQEVGRG